MKHIKRVIAQIMIVILLAGGVFPHVGLWDFTSRAALEGGFAGNADSYASSSDASDSDAVFSDGEELIDDRIASDSNMEKPFYFEDVIDGVTVIMSAEKGVLPEGTVVDISIVPAEESGEIKQRIKEQVSSEKQIEDIISFNITLLYDGEEIEPATGSVNVSFVLPEKKNVRSYETEVYHISDETKEVEKIDTKVEEDGAVRIQAEQFSVYAVTTFSNNSKDPFPGTNLDDDWSGERIFFGRAPQADISKQEEEMLSKTAPDAFSHKKEIFLNGEKYNSNSKYTPIEWRILDDRDGQYLLLSEYVLDAYNWNSIWNGDEPTWESSDIRKWLNEDFMDQIFTVDEQDAIPVTFVDNSRESGSRVEGDVDTEDQVFLPSCADLLNREYGFPESGETPSRQTDYIKGVRTKITAGAGSIPDANHKNSYYWTRSRWVYDRVGVKPFFVTNSGAVVGGGTVYHTWVLGVRPELTLDSSLEVWSEDENDDRLLYGMRFQETECDMHIGEEKKLQLEFLNWAADAGDITWHSSNPDSVTVDSDGTIHALNVGKAGITAYYGSIAAYCEVTVVGDENYKITYELYGGNNHPENPVSYAEGATIILQAPTKENYRFIGWYTTETCDSNSYIEEIPASMKGDLTLYANWLLMKQEEVTEIQYLVLSELVYHNLEPYTFDKYRRTIPQIADAISGQRMFNNKTINGMYYAELYKQCLPGWIIEDVFTGQTGFYAAVFENLASGKKVFVFRGSDDIKDDVNWSDNDWEENLNYTILDIATQQFNDAIQYLGNYIAKNGSDNLSIAGHSLGGGLGILASNVFGLPAHTFNASATLDVSYYRLWDIMSRNFDGIDQWKYMDHINEHDLVVGLWEKEMKRSTDYKDLNKDLNPFGPHGLESLIFYQWQDGEEYSLPPVIRTRDFSPGDTLEKEVNKLTPECFIPAIREPLLWGGATFILYESEIMSQGGLKLGSSAKDIFNGRNNLVPHTEVIYGGIGNDVLNGFNGDDYLIGGPGNDRLDGNSGNDTYIYWKGQGTDTIYDVQGTDKLKLYGFEKGDEIIVDNSSDPEFVLLTYEGETITKINRNRKKKKDQTFLVTVIKDEREQKLLYIEDWFRDCPDLQKFTIKCPVQVDVYDKNQQLRMTVDSANEGSWYTEFGNIYVVYDEEEQDRIVVMDLFNKDYTLSIKGTDTGTMDVTVQTEESETPKTYVSEGLPLSKQHQYKLTRDKNLIPHLYLVSDEQGTKNNEVEMKDENGVSTLPKNETGNGSHGSGGGGSSSGKRVESQPDTYPGAYWLRLETGQWKLMKADQTEVTGWARVKGYWYYLNPVDGIMQTGWIMDADRRWYYLTDSGAMLTGWLFWQNNWYYLDQSGVMRTGWVKVENQWYYLQGNGAMLANAVTPDGYQVGESGAWRQ